MKIVSDSMLQAWQQRSTREQYLLVVGFVLALVAAVYLGIVDPVLREHHEARAQYQEAFEDYRWLQNQSALLKRLHSETGNLIVSRPLPEIEENATTSLKKLGLRSTVKLVKKNAKEYVEIEIQQAPAVQLMRWLDSFSEGGVVVHRLELQNRKGFLAGTLLLGN